LKSIKERLGYDVPTFLRSVAELESILSQDSYRGIELTSDTRFCVLFTNELMNTRIALPQHSSKNDIDLISVNPYEAFTVWRIINGKPPAGKFAEATIPAKNTGRFYHTLVKILQAAKTK